MGIPRVEDGLAMHQAGQLAGARSVYQQILDERPRDAIALHYMGVLAHQGGRTDEALTWMRQAIDASPRIPDFHCNLGVLFRDIGRLPEAAAELCKAIQLRPAYPEALNNLGDVLRQQGRLAEAENVLRQSIAVRPSAAALNNLGLVLTDAANYAEAARALRDALRMNPADTRTLKNLGTALLQDGRTSEAAQCCRAAIAADESDAEAWFGLGNALRLAGDVPAALEAFERAARLDPDHPDLLINLSATQCDAGEIDAAIQTGCRAVALRPSSPLARYNLSVALLTAGRMSDGWKLYEARWNCPGYYGTLLLLPQSIWDGADPAGKTILLRAEQGCGDTIQFARYVPMLAARGANVVLECQPELKSILTSLDGGATIVARGEPPGRFDYHLPLLSLPLHFATTLETIPADGPYLRADPARTDVWRHRLAGLHGFKCGIVWRGSPRHRNDKERSMPLSALAPLAGMEGVRFFSLQKEGIGQHEPLAIPDMIDLSRDLRDFADTAAALTQMDLVISVDTAVAHLAGALGRPVWTLLPRVADWRWMRDTDRSPWYPTMRLFRQATSSQWAPVIDLVAAELSEWRGLSPAAQCPARPMTMHEAKPA
jgi:tetratricopeptide (TPR) repeat protein